MLGRRYTNSPEVALMNKQSRDKKKLVGTCGSCIRLKQMGDIPYCSEDLSEFSNRFKMGERCKGFLHTR